MYYINKIVWFFFNPMMLLLVASLVGLLLQRRYPRAGKIVIFSALGLLYLASTYISVFLLGYPLEKRYVCYEDASAAPRASAIVLLGGGMRYVPSMKYPNMYDAADRVWQASRLYKAGKAPVVIVSGKHDLEATVPLLLDFGVPMEAIRVDNESRNTYENSRFTAALIGKGEKVLLVTSAWHMARASANFAASGLEVVPSACDFIVIGGDDDFYFWDYITPSPVNLLHMQMLAKEWLGRLAQR